MASYDPAVLAAYLEQQRQQGTVSSFTNIGTPGPDEFFLNEGGDNVAPENVARIPIDKFTSAVEAEDELLRIKQELERKVQAEQESLYANSDIPRIESFNNVLSGFIAAGQGESFKQQFNDNSVMIAKKKAKMAEELGFQDGKIVGRQASKYLADTQYMEGLAMRAKRLKGQEDADASLAQSVDKAKAAIGLELGVSPREEAVLRTMFPMQDADWEASKLGVNSPLRKPNLVKLANDIVNGKRHDVKTSLLSGDPEATEALVRYYGQEQGDATTQGRLGLMQSWQKDIDMAAQQAQSELMAGSATGKGRNKNADALVARFAGATKDEKAAILGQVGRTARLQALQAKQGEFVQNTLTKNFNALALEGLNLKPEEEAIADIAISAFQTAIDSGKSFAEASKSIRTSVQQAQAASSHQSVGIADTLMPTGNPTLVGQDIAMFNVLNKLTANISRNFNTRNQGFIQITPQDDIFRPLKASGIIALFTSGTQ